MLLVRRSIWRLLCDSNIHFRSAGDTNVSSAGLKYPGKRLLDITLQSDSIHVVGLSGRRNRGSS